MFDRLPSFVRVGLFCLLLGTCGAQIARNAMAAPVTEPVAKDVKKAEREAASRVGGPDVKAPLPAVGPGVVGGNGVVEPAGQETKVAAQVSAVVKAVLVHEGQQVKAGEVLVQLEDAFEAAALQAAEADLVAERANLARVLKGLRVEDKDAAQGEAQAAKARADLSSGVLARVEQLAKSGASTPDELERARRQAQSDQASLKVAEARARAAEAGSRSEDIGFARARVVGAEAKVAQAKAALERLSVRSPLEGEVLQVKVRAGELYSFQGTEPLVVMGDTRTLRVRMDVDERDIAKVALGASAYVTADAFGDTRFAGKVVEIGRRFGRKNVRTDDPVEKNDTKILEVVIELDSSKSLVPGQRVTSFVTAATQG
ncbi:MAG: efflux RND transporter periplasmic adaptor subunit [Myxococcaceae bacterium]|nr:efflux RND transporter periplasmic adaptor subunit [Myxococcaceae bacterium]